MARGMRLALMAFASVSGAVAALLHVATAGGTASPWWSEVGAPRAKAELFAILAATVAVALVVVATERAQGWLDRAGETLNHWVERPHGPALVAVGLAAIAAALRLPFLTADPLTPFITNSADFATDVGLWSSLARDWCAGRGGSAGPDLAAGAASLPYTAVQFGACRLFGRGLLAMRLGSAVLGSLAAPLLFLGLRRALGAALACAAGLVVATSHVLVMHHRTGMVDGFLFFLLAASLWAWLTAAHRPSLRRGAALGLVVGVAVLTRVTALVFVAALVAWLGGQAVRRAEGWGRVLAGTVIGVGVVGAVAVLCYAGAPLVLQRGVETLRVATGQLPESFAALATRLRRVTRDNPVSLHMPMSTALAAMTVMGMVVGAVARALHGRRAPVSSPPSCAMRPGPTALAATPAVPTVPALRAALAEPTLPTLTAFMALWWVGGLAMLVANGYAPTRYFLQGILPFTVLALVGARWLWQATGERSLVRALLVALIAAEVLSSLVRTGAWMAAPSYSQQEVATAIARAVPSHSVVAGTYGFSLALSADAFTPLGFRPGRDSSPATLAREGATHLLIPGPLAPEAWSALLAVGVHPELRGHYRYLDDYFEPHADLWLYELVRGRDATAP